VCSNSIQGRHRLPWIPLAVAHPQQVHFDCHGGDAEHVQEVGCVDVLGISQLAFVPAGRAELS